MSQDELVYAAKATVTGKISSDNGNFSTDGVSGNISGGTVTGTGIVKGASLQSTSGKFSMTALADIADYSGAQAVRKLGPTSTTLKDNIAATTTNWTDTNANQINSGGGIISASTNGAKAHNYAGTLTPTLINTTLTSAGTVIWGTIGTANATITMSAAAAFTAQAILC